MEIPNINDINVRSTNINVRSINVSEIRNPNIRQLWLRPIFDVYTPRVFVPIAPITATLRRPVVDYPGCVEHAVAIEDDRKLIKCDGEVPHYNAMDYTPENLIVTREVPPPSVDPPTPPETPEVEPPNIPKTDAEVPCPGPNQPRIGDVAQNQKEKVSGYELQPDPNNQGKQICVILYEDIGIVEQFLPSSQVVSTTAVIATVATTSALLAKPLADLLLKVVKPAVKKLMTKLKSLAGKTGSIESKGERLVAQRERNRTILALRRSLK